MVASFTVHQVRAYAKMMSISYEEAEAILQSINMFFFKEALHTKSFTLPSLGTFKMQSFKRDFPKKVSFTHKVTPNSLSDFLRQRDVPLKDLFMTARDMKSFDNLIGEIYGVSNRKSND